MNIDELEEFPGIYNMAHDIDAFADETGYEGSYNDHEFFFPSFNNPNSERYDAFDPYEEDEWIATGSVANKNIYGQSYEHSQGEYEHETQEEIKTVQVIIS